MAGLVGEPHGAFRFPSVHRTGMHLTDQSGTTVFQQILRQSFPSRSSSSTVRIPGGSGSSRSFFLRKAAPHNFGSGNVTVELL